MADEIVLYTNPQSRGAMAHWMLEEVGAPYRIEVLAFGPQMKSPEYLALNPMGKVPTVKHGDTVITETGAILAYLADAFPQAKLAPSGHDRGAYFRWLFFVAGCCDPAMSNKSVGWNTTPDLEPRFGYGTYDRTIDTAAKAVEGKRYIVGDRFTAADLYMASFLHWGMMFGVVDKRPAFENYVKPHLDRPAAKRAEEQAAKLTAK